MSPADAPERKKERGPRRGSGGGGSVTYNYKHFAVYIIEVVSLIAGNCMPTYFV